MSRSKPLRRLDRIGYTVIRNLVNEATVARYRELIADVVDTKPVPHTFDFIQFAPDEFLSWMNTNLTLSSCFSTLGAQPRYDHSFCYTHNAEQAYVGGQLQKGEFFFRAGPLCLASSLHVVIPLQEQRVMAFAPGSHVPYQDIVSETARDETGAPTLLPGDGLVHFGTTIRRYCSIERSRRQLLTFVFTPANMAFQPWHKPAWLPQIHEDRRHFFRNPCEANIDEDAESE